MNICIVDDENKNIESLEDMLEIYSKENDIVFNISSFNDSEKFISEYKPIYDIVFLDIVMPKFDGLEVAKRIRDIDKKVILIFITNISKYAIKGYEYDAANYLLKPVNYTDLKENLNKAMSLMEKLNISKSIYLKTKTGFIRILLSEFMYADVIGHTVTVHTTNENYVVKESLSTLAKKLKDEYFIQCNVCYLLNPKYITLTTKNAFYIGQTKFPVSRLRKKDSINTLMNFLNKN